MGNKFRILLMLTIVSAFTGMVLLPASAATATNIVEVDSGGLAHFALTDDGRVWTWGNNMYGQMGDVERKIIQTPFLIPGLSDVKAISADSSHTVVLKNDGTVWAAGKNDRGQLGDGTRTERTGFVQCKGLSGIVAISAMDDGTLALKDDGTVWQWGYYPYGSSPDEKNVTTPGQVSGLSDIKSISAGPGNFLAVDSSGDAWSWGNKPSGYDSNGQITYGAAVKLGISGVKQAAAGYQYSLFLKNDGTVWGLGWNSNGVLGIGKGKDASKGVPAQLPGLRDIVQVQAASECAAALKGDGTVYVWGYSPPGGFGMGLMMQSVYTPTQLPYLTDTKDLGARSKQMMLALEQNGTVFAAGSTLFYYDKETGTPARNTEVNQIKFLADTEPTAEPGDDTQPGDTSGSTSSGSDSKTPAPSALIAVGVLSLVALFVMRKK